MKDNKTPFDEHFQRQLSDLESPVPADLFDRLQARRGGAVPSDAPLRERFDGHESPIPADLFARLQARRGGAAPSDAPLRERFDGLESPVSSIIFDAVLAERERRKWRRLVLWRSSTAIAALLLIGAFLFQFNNKKDALNMPKTVENGAYTEGSLSELKIKNSELNSDETIANNSVNSELKNELNSDKTIANNSINSALKNELNSDKTIANSPINSQLNNAKTIANSGINAELKNNNSRLNTTKRSGNSAKMPKNVVYTEGSPSELKTSLRGTKQTNYELNSQLNSNNLIVNNGINSELINANNVELNSNKTIANSGLNAELINANLELKTALENRLMPFNSTILSLDFLNIISPKPLILSAQNRKNPCREPGNGCPTFGMRKRGKGTTFYVDAFVAPENVMRRFTKNLAESEKLLAARDSVEQTQYAVSTGARVSVVFGNGLALRTGLVFNQINERARFDSLGVGSITTTYKEVILPNGKRDTVSTTITIVDGIFRKTRYNHYRSLDIPLQIGYEKAFKNGWTFGVNGGMNINIASWQKADIVGGDLRQLSVSSEINAPNPVYNTRVGMSFIGSVAAYRQLTKGLQLVIEPSIRLGLQPITRSDYALKQQYSTAGLIVGLRMKL
jgi:hypothetical protein